MWQDTRLTSLLGIEHPILQAPMAGAIKSAGAIVICSATTVDEARHLELLEVDIIVAQGGEAGGHRGTDHNQQHSSLVGTLALVPAVVDAAALGAAAVQLGTVFLGCPEAGIAESWLNRLEQAEADETDVTEVISGRPLAVFAIATLMN